VEASFKQWSRDNGFDFPDSLDGNRSGYFTDVHKDNAAISLNDVERKENLEKNAKVRRSLLDDF